MIAGAVLIIAAVILWIFWKEVIPVPQDKDLVQIDTSYEHPVLRLTVTPAPAAENLEINVQLQQLGKGASPPKWQTERTAGRIDVTLEEWEGGRDYLLTASMPEHPAMTLSEPLEYRFETPPEFAFDLVAVGDVMLDQMTRARLRDYDVNYPLARIKDLTASGDLNFANLECPISARGEPADKKYVFCASPHAAEVLNSGGFNLVSLANNHVLDYGPEALVDTIALLEERGIAHAGAGSDEEGARQGVVLEVNGLQVGLLAYTRPAPSWQYAAWAASSQQGGTVFYRDREKMLLDVARMRTEVDILIVSMHWGNEYTHQVTAGQRELGRLLVDNGADLVLGHHPHAPQGIEFYRDKPIIYSLGNFLFYPFDMGITDETFILKARLGRAGVEEMRLVPVLLGDSQPFVPEGPELERLQRVLGGLLEQFGTGYLVQGEELIIEIPR